MKLVNFVIVMLIFSVIIILPLYFHIISNDIGNFGDALYFFESVCLFMLFGDKFNKWFNSRLK